MRGQGRGPMYMSTYCVPGILIDVVRTHCICDTNLGSVELSVSIEPFQPFKNGGQTKSYQSSASY